MKIHCRILEDNPEILLFFGSSQPLKNQINTHKVTAIIISYGISQDPINKIICIIVESRFNPSEQSQCATIYSCNLQTIGSHYPYRCLLTNIWPIATEDILEWRSREWSLKTKPSRPETSKALVSIWLNKDWESQKLMTPNRLKLVQFKITFSFLKERRCSEHWIEGQLLLRFI